MVCRAQSAQLSKSAASETGAHLCLKHLMSIFQTIRPREVALQETALDFTQDIFEILKNINKDQVLLSY